MMRGKPSALPPSFRPAQIARRSRCRQRHPAPRCPRLKCRLRRTRLLPNLPTPPPSGQRRPLPGTPTMSGHEAQAVSRRLLRQRIPRNSLTAKGHAVTAAFLPAQRLRLRCLRRLRRAWLSLSPPKSLRRLSNCPCFRPLRLPLRFKHTSPRPPEHAGRIRNKPPPRRRPRRPLSAYRFP
jgi:hypothetical protein